MRFRRKITNLPIPEPPKLVESKVTENEEDSADIDQKAEEAPEALPQISLNAKQQGDEPSEESTMVLMPKKLDGLGPTATDEIDFLPVVGDHLRTVPAFEELCEMQEHELACLQEFEVHSHFGKIKWIGPVDIRGMDIGSVVVFKQGGVSLYPDGHKPAWGEGLNSHCQVMLYDCWPKAYYEGRRVSQASLDKYAKRLEHFCIKHGLLFQKYENGFWEFELGSVLVEEDDRSF